MKYKKIVIGILIVVTILGIYRYNNIDMDREYETLSSVARDNVKIQGTGCTSNGPCPSGSGPEACENACACGGEVSGDICVGFICAPTPPSSSE